MNMYSSEFFLAAVENLVQSSSFRHQLEHAAVTCQSTVITFVDQTHFIQPMHKKDQFCFALIDTNTGL